MANKNQKFWVRALCIGLVAVMVISTAILAITLIINGLSQDAAALIVR